MGLYAKYKVMPSGLVAPERHVFHDFQHTGDSDMGQAPHSFKGLVHKGSNIIIGDGEDAISSEREAANYKYQNTFMLLGLGRGAGNGENIVRWTLKDNRNDGPPGSATFYGVVLLKLAAAGHTSAYGNGSKISWYSIEYNGTTPSTLNTTNIVSVAQAPTFTVSHSGWTTTVEVSGGGSGGGGLNCTCDVEIIFSRGAGGTGSYVYFDLEELH